MEENKQKNSDNEKTSETLTDRLISWFKRNRESQIRRETITANDREKIREQIKSVKDRALNIQDKDYSESLFMEFKHILSDYEEICLSYCYSIGNIRTTDKQNQAKNETRINNIRLRLHLSEIISHRKNRSRQDSDSYYNQEENNARLDSVNFESCFQTLKTTSTSFNIPALKKAKIESRIKKCWEDFERKINAIYVIEEREDSAISVNSEQIKNIKEKDSSEIIVRPES